MIVSSASIRRVLLKDDSDTCGINGRSSGEPTLKDPFHVSKEETKEVSGGLSLAAIGSVGKTFGKRGESSLRVLRHPVVDLMHCGASKEGSSDQIGELFFAARDSDDECLLDSSTRTRYLGSFEPTGSSRDSFVSVGGSRRGSSLCSDDDSDDDTTDMLSTESDSNLARETALKALIESNNYSKAHCFGSPPRRHLATRDKPSPQKNIATPERVRDLKRALKRGDINVEYDLPGKEVKAVSAATDALRPKPSDKTPERKKKVSEIADLSNLVFRRLTFPSDAEGDVEGKLTRNMESPEAHRGLAAYCLRPDTPRWGRRLIKDLNNAARSNLESKGTVISVPSGTLFPECIYNLDHITSHQTSGGFHFCPATSPLFKTLTVHAVSSSTGVFYSSFSLRSGKIKQSSFFPKSISTVEELKNLLDRRVLVGFIDNRYLFSCKLENGKHLLIESYMRHNKLVMNSFFPIFAHYHYQEDVDSDFVVTEDLRFTKVEIFSQIKSIFSNTPPLKLQTVCKYYLDSHEVVIDIAPSLGDTSLVNKGIYVTIPIVCLVKIDRDEVMSKLEFIFGEDSIFSDDKK